MKNYYEILGINQRATDGEIKKRFRELAKQFHPDKNNSKTAEDQFKKIQSAYETLSNPQKKVEYDRVNSPSYHKPESFNWKPTIVVLIVTLVVMITAYVLTSNRKKSMVVV